VTIALYATIWVALALFVLGEAGKPAPMSARGADRSEPRASARAAELALATAVAWRIWALGALLAAVHIPIAFAARYQWSHLAAEQETARRTAEMFGVYWAGGVFVNYLFIAAWLVEAWWWRARPAGYARRPAWLVWPLRAFYLVIIVNAAVVFASPIGRWPGAVLVAALIWIWRPRPGAPSIA
jgi:hypothetical protein